MCDDLSRRNAMTTGAAFALAAPFSPLTAAQSSAAEDWPEFKPWLVDAIALDVHYAESAKLDCSAGSPDLDKIHEREKWEDDEMERLCVAARAMAAKPVLTERHLAMLVSLAVWATSKGTLTWNNFNVATISNPTSDLQDYVAAFLLMLLAQRAAVVLPEVPFTFQAEV